MANPSKLDAKFITDFCGIIRRGCMKQTAVGKLGVRKSLFSQWWKRGREASEHRDKHNLGDEAFTDHQLLCERLFIEGTKARCEANELMETAITQCEDPKVILQFMKLTRRDMSGLYYQDEATGEETKVDPVVLCLDRIELLRDK